MLVSRFCDERSAYAACRRVRYTWMLMLASTLHLFALPLWAQQFHDELAGGRFPYLDVSVDAAPTTVEQWILWWLPQFAVPIVALALAGNLPRLIHRQWLSRLEPLMVEGEIGHVATYRQAPHRQFFMHPRDLQRLAHAYGARLAGLAILLVIGVIPTYNEAFPMSGGHYPRSVTFSPVEIYLPLFVVTVLILLVNAPTQARFFGCHQQPRANLEPLRNGEPSGT